MIDDTAEPTVADFELPRVLAALADRHRLATVRFVARNGESWCARVMEGAGLAMSKSTFSHHLRILREAGVIATRHEGTRSYMCVRKADLDARFPGLIDSVLNADAELIGPTLVGADRAYLLAAPAQAARPVPRSARSRYPSRDSARYRARISTGG